MSTRAEKRRARAKGDDYAVLGGLPHLGRYRMFSADVPWAHDNYGQARHGAAKSAYSEMPLESVCAMPVRELAHEQGAVLLLWCTAAQAADGAHLAVAGAWGFRLVTRAFTWVKCSKACAGCGHEWDEHAPPGVTDDAPGACAHGYGACCCEHFVVRATRGPGSYSMQGVEDVWLGLRGDGWSSARAERDVPEVIFAPRGEHSRKPDVMQLRAERLWPEAGPRLELFARRRLDGWASFGNEVEGCDEVFGQAIGKHWPTLAVGDVVELAVSETGWQPGKVEWVAEHGFGVTRPSLLREGEGETVSRSWADERVSWRRIK